MAPLIYITRHGEALHNLHKGYPDRDPPLTKAGQYHEAHRIRHRARLDPNLTHDTDYPNCYEHVSIPYREKFFQNGLSRAALVSKFPQFDFSECHEEWDYPDHTVAQATARAESVRSRIKNLSVTYKSIAIITHRGFKAFLVKGKRFGLAETRCYRFATEEEAQDESVRWGLNCDTLKEQDFGPTVLILEKSQRKDRLGEGELN